jgi:hypothetical protein
VNPVTQVRSWRKLFPDLEEDYLQGFPNEEICKSEILDMVCAVRSFEKNQRRNVEEWLQSDACEGGFHHMTNRQTLSMLLLKRREKTRVGRMRVKFVLP